MAPARMLLLLQTAHRLDVVTMLSLRLTVLRLPTTKTPVRPLVRAYTSSRDPSHPHLYYHPLTSTARPTLALSFLPDPPRRGAESRTVIGFLPADEGAGLDDFKENPPFLYVSLFTDLPPLGQLNHLASQTSSARSDKISSRRRRSPNSRDGGLCTWLGRIHAYRGYVLLPHQVDSPVAR